MPSRTLVSCNDDSVSFHFFLPSLRVSDVRGRSFHLAVIFISHSSRTSLATYIYLISINDPTADSLSISHPRCIFMPVVHFIGTGSFLRHTVILHDTRRVECLSIDNVALLGILILIHRYLQMYMAHQSSHASCTTLHYTTYFLFLFWIYYHLQPYLSSFEVYTQFSGFSFFFSFSLITSDVMVHV